MAPPRASWKGYLKIAELTCPVALYAAASSAERIALHLINGKTGHRVHRQFVDAATGAPVERDDQVKGYEVERDEYVILEPEEILAAVPESDKTLNVSAFIATSDVDDVYFDRPYTLGPSDRSAEEAFALIREGLRVADVSAVAQTVLFRRVRTMLIRPLESGLSATTLNYDYEVRAAEDAFADVPALRIKGEMLELAKHIIDTKRGAFDPAAFHDRYEEALADLVKAKLEGRAIEAPKPPKPQRAADLMAALRESAGLGPRGPSGPARKKPAARRAASAMASPRRKAS
ncbi:MAG: Ku protein [Hyphomicrobiales bacterium]|nr:Ku protein [Hyphomicrobiales bacterium]MBV8441716.1 Ku protein [Hyphomicrobiales bacterium]